MIMAKLFYVIGASGSGKDSLMHYARHQLSGQQDFVFAHRYITRPADAGGENHVALTEAEFHVRQQQGCFAMCWYAHDTWYGIGIEIHQWLAKGIHVVMNGSRAYLDQAAELYPELQPVLVCVQPALLRDRLIQRGRETEDEIEHRLIQARALESSTLHPNLLKIENNRGLAVVGKAFVNLLQQVANSKQCA